MSQNQKFVLFSRLLLDTLPAMIVDQTEVVVPNKADGAVLLLQSDILALKQFSRILGHCKSQALLVSHYQASI